MQKHVGRKIALSHAASVAIIYPEGDPSLIFAERKSETHPDPSARGGVNLIGGNWAKNDVSPRETIIRELREELKVKTESGTTEDATTLQKIREEIISRLIPFGAFLNIPQDESSASHREPALVYLFTCGLKGKPWESLVDLQNRHKDLSAEEPVTVIVSLDDFISGKERAALGSAHTLQRFWLEKGLTRAEELPTNDGYTSAHVGLPHSSYKEASEIYKFKETPA